YTLLGRETKLTKPKPNQQPDPHEIRSSRHRCRRGATTFSTGVRLHRNGGGRNTAAECLVYECLYGETFSIKLVDVDYQHQNAVI
ncbi:MAG: hypothetical protein DRO11_07455, partial [Methanobacteriota archaeon]